MILSRSGTVRIEFEVLASDHEVLGHRLDRLSVPRGVRVVQLNRGLRAYPPGSGTRIRAGDVLVVLADLDQETALRSWLADDPGWTYGLGRDTRDGPRPT